MCKLTTTVVFSFVLVSAAHAASDRYYVQQNVETKECAVVASKIVGNGRQMVAAKEGYTTEKDAHRAITDTPACK
jgi:hypothetical protein